MVAGQYVHGGVDQAAFLDLIDIIHQILIAVFFNEVVIVEFRVVLFAYDDSENFISARIIDAVILYQGMFPVISNGLIVEQFSEHLTIIHVVGINNSIGTGGTLIHPEIHKGNTVVIAGPGEVPPLVIAVVHRLYHSIIHLCVRDLDPAGDVLILGIEVGKLGQIGGRISIDHSCVGSGDVVADEATERIGQLAVIVPLQINAADIHQTAEEHRQTHCHRDDPHLVVGGELTRPESLHQAAFFGWLFHVGGILLLTCSLLFTPGT